MTLFEPAIWIYPTTYNKILNEKASRRPKTLAVFAIGGLITAMNQIRLFGSNIITFELLGSPLTTPCTTKTVATSEWVEKALFVTIRWTIV